MTELPPRVLGALVGDIARDPGAHTKYHLLFEALGRRVNLLGVYDASLRGPVRWFNALAVAHPDQRRWRERFYKNTGAFRGRSRQMATHLETLRGQVDVILQVGVLFNAHWSDDDPPNVIYTDYTAHLSAQHPEGGRSPFTPAQRVRWIELESRALKRAAHICTRGELARASLIADYGLPPERVTAIGGGVNFPTLPALPTRDPNAPPTLLFLGKELYRKGGDLVLKAFALARAYLPEAQLLFVTGDPIPEGLPLDGVQVIPPTWDRAAIAALYERADAFVLPSRLETWGDVLLEAMAYALPCVGVARQTMEEIIEHERTGLLVPPEDCEALAEALVRVLSDLGQRLRWGQAARQKVEVCYTWERVAERLASVLEEAAQLSVMR